MTTAPLVYGKYQLLTRLAKGSLGEVWKARSHGVEGFEKILVIKRVARELSLDEAFVTCFIDEVKTAVLLTHANVVQVFDLGHVDDTYFLATEYVRGLDLGTLLGFARQKGERMPDALAIYVASELAKGLDYAHRRRDAELVPLGVVHRGVTPDNVLLSFEGEVKLTDFGMARARACVRALADLPSDKLAYLAPEQVRDQALDGRADLYALGVILHELLTGMRVLERDVPRERAQELLDRARSGERLALRASYAPALAAIVERATSPEPAQRYENAGELYEELIGLLYESGRRVGALELARWLEEASRGAPELAGEALGPFSGIEEIFGEPPRSLPAPTRVLLVVDDAEARELLPRAEWRDVSVLLVDGRDARALATLAARFGGEVLTVGDEALLVFGLGETGGRDAEAAARCGFTLLRVRGDERLRAIVHSGSVLLDAEGHIAQQAAKELLESEARRWLKRARNGELVATPSAVAVLRERFELAREPENGARAVLRERVAGEGAGKFVGRRDELRAIGEVFARANRAQLCTLGLRGEAGSGKSRVIFEIARRLKNAGHDVGIYIATCSPQGRAIPFFAVQELVRAVLGLEDLDAPARVIEQIDRLRMLGLSAEQREAFTRLLGVASEAGESSTNVGKLETALVRVAYKLAQDRLTVFVWDGAEHMDAASIELVTKLLSTSLASRVLVLFTYRPGQAPPWAKLPGYSEVLLGPLADEEVARLVRHRLGASEVHPELVREVMLKTGGNPLFVEELIGALRESAAIEVDQGIARIARRGVPLELPRTLRGMVASRVGKLTAAQRLILQLAVTFGPRFAPHLLARAAGLDEHTVDDALAQLSEREIVRSVGPSEYAFANELVREVLYAAISLDERPSLHAAVAHALETLAPGELEPAIERLAYHYREAGEWDAAVRYLLRAGERFEGEHALDAAIDVYTQALELASREAEPDRERVLALHARIGELAYHTRSSEAVADRMGAAIELAERWGAEEHVARFAMLRGRLLNKASRFREGGLWLERALAIARKLEHGALEREIALAAAEAHARNGEYKAVVQYVGDALAVARVADDVPAQVRGLLVIVPAHAALGELEQARAALRELEQLVGSAPGRHVELELERVRATVLEAAGEHDEAHEIARRALDRAKQYELPYDVALTAFQLGAQCLRAEQDKRAFAALRLSHETASEHGYTRIAYRNACMMGFLDAMRFDSEQGYARMQEAVEYAEERAYVLDLVEDKFLLAMVEQKRGQLERARALLRDVIELADAHGHVRACEYAEQALRALDEGTPIALPR